MTSQTQSISVLLPNVIVNVDLLVSAGHFLDRLDLWRPMFDVAATSIADPELDRRLRRSIYRYERLWLPMLAELDAPTPKPNDLEPPTDVSWIWHMHQLHPQHYAEYCRQFFGRVLAHKVRPPRGPDATRAAERTATVWRQRYPGVPFEISTTAADTGNAAPDVRLAELIFAIVRREVDFAYQVALPHFRDQNFLYAAVERYRKWLLLRQLRPGDAPNVRLPVDVELVARVHAIHPIQYATDIARLFPSLKGTLPNSVVQGNATEADFLPAAIDRSNEIWRSVFRGEKLFLAGTGHRGRPTVVGVYSSPLVEFPRDALPSSRSTLESCDLSFSEVTVEDLLWSKSKQVIVEAHLLGENSLVQRTVFRTSGPVGSTMSGTGPTTPSALGTTHFEAQHNRGIELVVYGRRGFACLARDRKLATKQFNPLQSVGLSGTLDSSMTLTLPKVTYTDPKITITFNIQGANQKPLVFTLDRNAPTRGPLTTELRQLAGPLPAWSTIITSADSLFVRARHGLKCRDGYLGFGVEILKHDRTNMAAVLLFHNSKDLVSAAYSIDADQLPDPSQVSELCPLTFDVQEGDHAMLIRNQRGDFGVCVARWQHNVNSTHGGNGGEGKILYRLYLFANRQTVKFEVRDDEMSSVKVTTPDGSVEVDLPTGRLTVDANVVPLPEYLTLAFVVGVLFVTIQKTSFMQSQPDTWPSGSVRSAHSGVAGRSSPVVSEASSHRSAASRLAARFHNGGGSNQSVNQKKKTNKRRKMSASFTFLLACGLQIDVALFGSGPGIDLPVPNGSGSVRVNGAGQQANGEADGVRRVNVNGGSVNGTSNGRANPSNGSGKFVDVRF